MNRPRRTQGFTLPELLAYLGVTAILFVALTALLANLGHGLRRAQAQRELADVGRTALTTISNEIRRAKSIVDVTSSSLTIERPDGAIVTIALSGSQLLRGTTPLVSDHVTVSQATFTRMGDVVRLALTVAPEVADSGIGPVDVTSVATVRRTYY